MTITFENPRDYVKKNSDEFATVDKRTKRFLRTDLVEEKKIFRQGYSVHWQYLDTGAYTPGYQVEQLFQGYLGRLRASA